MNTKKKVRPTTFPIIKNFGIPEDLRKKVPDLTLNGMEVGDAILVETAQQDKGYKKWVTRLFNICKRHGLKSIDFKAYHEKKTGDVYIIRRSVTQ